jgi:hypothetical protein
MGKERNPYNKDWMPTLLMKAKINPYLPKKKDAKIGKKSWTPRVIRKETKDNIKGKKVAPRITMQSDPSRIDPKYFLPILSLDQILLKLESR